MLDHLIYVLVSAAVWSLCRLGCRIKYFLLSSNNAQRSWSKWLCAAKLSFNVDHQSLGGGRDGGGARGPGGARAGGGPGGGMATGGGARAGGSMRGPLDGGFVRGTELEIRGISAAAGGGGGREPEWTVRGGARSVLWASPSLTRWKLMQRPCQRTECRFRCRISVSAKSKSL